MFLVLPDSVSVLFSKQNPNSHRRSLFIAERLIYTRRIQPVLRYVLC